MEKYINEYGKECWRDVTEKTPFSKEYFHKPEYQGLEGDSSYALHTNLGSLTVVNRKTGFIGSPRDTESGYRDIDGKFWLATGNVDVMESGCKTVGDAIKFVKDNSNTCIGC